MLSMITYKIHGGQREGPGGGGSKIVSQERPNLGYFICIAADHLNLPVYEKCEDC